MDSTTRTRKKILESTTKSKKPMSPTTTTHMPHTTPKSSKRKNCIDGSSSQTVALGHSDGREEVELAGFMRRQLGFAVATGLRINKSQPVFFWVFWQNIRNQTKQIENQSSFFKVRWSEPPKKIRFCGTCLSYKIHNKKIK